MKRWSPERDAIVRRDYPAGVSRQLIAERCNALPGASVELAHITMRAKLLKVRRSAEYMADLNKARQTLMVNARRPHTRTAPIDLTGVPPTSQILMAAPGTALPPVPERWSEIRSTALRDDGCWLGNQGDLIGYNRKRIARGQAPFVVEVR